MFNPKTLTDKLDSLTETVTKLNDRLDKKDVYIAYLEAILSTVEADLDLLEQYSRRSNLRFFGIPKWGEGEDTTRKLLAIVNETMAVTPPIVSADVVCHKPSARTAFARCRRSYTPTTSDREICHGARARRGHPSETPLAGKRRRTHRLRERRSDTSPGGEN